MATASQMLISMTLPRDSKEASSNFFTAPTTAESTNTLPTP
jgi:hypothetical protein